MCSSESLLLGLEGIKNGVCNVESRTSEFAEILLAAFLNGADTESAVENEMAKLTEAIGQLREIIQTIEAKIRRHADEDNAQNFIKLEVESFEDEALEFEIPDVKHSIELIETEMYSVNEDNVSVNCLEAEGQKLMSSYSHARDQEESADEPKRKSYKGSRTRKAGFSNSVRKKRIKVRKSKPESTNALMDETRKSTLERHTSYTSNDVRLRQEVKVSLTRLPENELLSSVTNNLTGEVPIKRAAAVKALGNFRKKKSNDSSSESSFEGWLDAEAEESDFKSDMDSEPDEEMLKDNWKYFPRLLHNQSSKSKKESVKSAKSSCPKCGVMLVPRHMKNHVKLHDDPTVFNFVCSICSVRFVSESHFKSHQQSHEQAFRCPHCEMKYGTLAGLEVHKTKKHSTNPNDTVNPAAVNQICRWCLKEKSFKNKVGLAFHEARCLRFLGNSKNPAEGPWKCSKYECSHRKPFSNISEFKIHMKSGVHPSPSDQDGLLQETQESSEGEKEMFNCPKCNESHGPKSFFSHVQFCLCGGHQGAAIDCPLPMCKIAFASIRSFVEHLKMHQRKERSPNISSLFQCSKCEKRFAYERTYVRHLSVIHSTDRPFSCNECPFTCKWKVSLKKHLRTIHPSQENPAWQRVICDQCGHTFVNKNCLDRHVKQVHLDVRPYNCTLCDKRFKTRNHLDYHLKTHDNPNGRKRSLNKPRRKPVYRTAPPLSKKKWVTDDSIADFPVPVSSARDNSVMPSVFDVTATELERQVENLL